MEAYPFIALSLLLMMVVAVAALFLAGKSSKSSNCDDPKNPTEKSDEHKFF
ncbi:MAG: single-stranded DNA-binding protein [Candidatus Thiodiazotropha sp.]